MKNSKEQGRIGIMGGSGLYDIPELKNAKPNKITTPFGSPSDDLVTATWEGREMVFLPRHGRGHRIAPHEINHRANLWAMKSLGVKWLLSVSAVGSLQEKLKPLDVVLPDQFLDRTKKSAEHTFFGNGIVAHVSFADPICKELQQLLFTTAKSVLPSNHVHLGGTYVNIEGPGFSTRAESEAYRKLNCDVIGMTMVGEAKLAREAEICFAALSMVTDYDCWKKDEQPVTTQMVIARLNENADAAKKILKTVIPKIPLDPGCSCHHALKNSIVTVRNFWPEETARNLKPILEKYVLYCS